LPRALQWSAGALLTLLILAALFVALFDWNWLRAPLERQALAQTGRVLLIKGQLDVQLGWPWPRVQAHQVTFANPPWATHPNLLSADEVAFSIHLPQLLASRLVVSDLHLVRPQVYLELGPDGRKTWLLDTKQQNDQTSVRIDRLSLDDGSIGYDDPASQTSILAQISTLPSASGNPLGTGVSVKAQGQYKGLPLKAHGTGDSVLALRDEATPYGLDIDATIGQTHLLAQGHMTSLLTLSEVDVQLTISGNNLKELFVLTGIATPSTADYVTQGHLTRVANTLRYDRFSGRVGTSDLSGWLELKTGGKRPRLTGNLVSDKLSLEDLGPVIGARPGQIQAIKRAVASSGPALAATPNVKRIIPDLPFEFSHWDSVDADVDFSAKSIRQATYMPLKTLTTHVHLQDSVLTLAPLQLSLAGGQLNAVIRLDGRYNPIQAKAQVQVKHLALAQLLPTDKRDKASTSRVGGAINLAGRGNSVGRMLANANGTAGLLISGGQISQMVMEKAGLHLWEMARLSLTGDKQVKLHCAVANFHVKNGLMQAHTLEFDTEVTTLLGSGTIDLAQEKLDLTFTQKTKKTSPLALRSPIHLGGNFVKPVMTVDRGRVAVRALGALALSTVNPLLLLVPLIDAGPGKDSDCAQWLGAKK
jgi:AsmA protein